MNSLSALPSLVLCRLHQLIINSFTFTFSGLLLSLAHKVTSLIGVGQVWTDYQIILAGTNWPGSEEANPLSFSNPLPYPHPLPHHLPLLHPHPHSHPAGPAGVSICLVVMCGTATSFSSGNAMASTSNVGHCHKTGIPTQNQ